MADVPLMSNPMTTAGDVMYGGASGAPTRLAAGTAGQVLKMNSGATAPEWDDESGGSGSALLGLTQYFPTGAGTNYSTTSTSYADVDATNLSVTFTAPASGNVLVRFTALAAQITGNSQIWAVREGTTNLAVSVAVSGAQSAIHRAVVWRLTGVTAGSHTYKLGWKVTGGTGNIYYGGSDQTSPNAPVVMEIWSAP